MKNVILNFPNKTKSWRPHSEAIISRIVDFSICSPTTDRNCFRKISLVTFPACYNPYRYMKRCVIILISTLQTKQESCLLTLNVSYRFVNSCIRSVGRKLSIFENNFPNGYFADALTWPEIITRVQLVSNTKSGNKIQSKPNKMNH